jgi:hypothetical protein
VKVTTDVGGFSKEISGAVIEFCRGYQMLIDIKDNVHFVCKVFVVFSVVRAEPVHKCNA